MAIGAYIIGDALLLGFAVGQVLLALTVFATLLLCNTVVGRGPNSVGKWMIGLVVTCVLQGPIAILAANLDLHVRMHSLTTFLAWLLIGTSHIIGLAIWVRKSPWWPLLLLLVGGVVTACLVIGGMERLGPPTFLLASWAAFSLLVFREGPSVSGLQTSRSL
jgi:hypothetical protein